MTHIQIHSRQIHSRDFRIRRLVKGNAAIAMIVASLALLAPAGAQAGAKTWEIWGKVSPQGKLETARVNVPRTVTITAFHNSYGAGFCIWSQGDSRGLLCHYPDSPTIIGKTLPKGTYFLIPMMMGNHVSAAAQATVTVK